MFRKLYLYGKLLYWLIYKEEFLCFIVILFVDVNYGEILSILRYVNRVKNIINKLIVNEVNIKLLNYLNKGIFYFEICKKLNL